MAILVLGYAYLTKLLPVGHPLNLMPDFYKPRVDVMLQDPTAGSGSLGSLLSQQGLGSIANLLGSGGGATGTSAQLAQFLLDSDVIKDSIAEEFHFSERYPAAKNPKTAARRKVANALGYEYMPGPGVLSITYKDTDKKFATEVLNRVVVILGSQFRDITLRRVLDKRQDLETRLTGAETEMNKAKQDLIDFSVRYGIVDINRQASNAADSQAQLRAQLTSKELELNNLLKGGRAQDDPLVKQIQNQMDGLNELLLEMQQGYREFTPVTIPQNQLPAVSSEYLRLQFEVTLTQGIYTVIRQNLEKVLLDEKDQTNLFQVLQPAEVPELKAGPSRARTCVIATIAAFFASVFLAFVAEYLDRAKRNPDESRKLAEIRRMLRLRKR